MTRKILSVSGFLGTGKDTAAQYLIDYHGFQKLAFADSLKDACAAVFGWPRHMLEGTTLESREWREQVDRWWAKRLGMPNLTPRWVLQYWGTEVCRHGFHDEIWVTSLERKLQQCENNVVITDLRFPNELAALRRNHGLAIRVVRGKDPVWVNDYHRLDLSEFQARHPHVHASEYSSVNLDYDKYVDNNSSLEDLYNQLRIVLA